MTAAEIPCGLAARIAALSGRDRTLVERFVRVLENRRRPDFETPDEFLRRRIEAARSRDD